MVVPLGPGKFYGSSLPRPRIYTDVKFNEDRVDPPAPILDPLLSWANEAHWSMGGLSFKRLRLQGRIEGNVQKLRKQREQILKNRSQSVSPNKDQTSGGKIFSAKKDSSESPSPPPAPVARKRRRLTLLVDEEDEAEGEDRQNISGVRKLARKLGEDFDGVAGSETGKRKKSQSSSFHGGNLESVASRTRSHRSDSEEGDEGGAKLIEESKKLKSKKSRNVESEGKMNGEECSVSVDGKRSSPRLLKKRS